MGFFSSALGLVKAVKSFDGANDYPDLKVPGIMLTYVEGLPGIGDLFKSLGPNRSKLYKAVIKAETDDDRVCGVLFSRYEING